MQGISEADKLYTCLCSSKYLIISQVDQVRESSLKHSDISKNILGLGKLVFTLKLVDNNGNDSGTF